MNKSLRKAVIAGNWKMNKTPAETTALINEIKPLVADADCCVPYVDLFAALEAAKGSNIKIGAENCTGQRAAHSQVRFPLKCSRLAALISLSQATAREEHTSVTQTLRFMTAQEQLLTTV